jgi:hypothetical protein
LADAVREYQRLQAEAGGGAHTTQVWRPGLLAGRRWGACACRSVQAHNARGGCKQQVYRGIAQGMGTQPWVWSHLCRAALAVCQAAAPAVPTMHHHRWAGACAACRAMVWHRWGGETGARCWMTLIGTWWRSAWARATACSAWRSGARLAAWWGTALLWATNSEMRAGCWAGTSGSSLQLQGAGVVPDAAIALACLRNQGLARRRCARPPQVLAAGSVHGGARGVGAARRQGAPARAAGLAGGA